MNPLRQTIDLGWGTLSYLDWHDPATTLSAPPVVLLHGGGLDNAWLSWGGLGSFLAEAGYRVMAPDHPGYGESPSAPWAVTQDRLVAYVGEFIDALGVREYAIGGLSLGGGMTIGHVLDRPEGISGAMLFGSYGLMDHQLEGWLARPAQLLSWALVRTGLMQRLMRAYVRNPKLLERSMPNLLRNPAERTPELVDAITAEYEHGTKYEPFAAWQRDQIRWNRLRTNYTEQLHTVTPPVLIIHGDHDPGVPASCARAAAEVIPQVRLVEVTDAGHWVQRDRPEIVNPEVRDFLDGLR